MTLMKNYGKRIIPRNIQEFDDLIGPSYRENEFDKVVMLLTSFWKRKGKSTAASSCISSGLLASSFKGKIDIDPLHILTHFCIGPDGIVYDKKDLFDAYMIDVFYIENESCYKFLSRFYTSLDWSIPTDLKAEYYTLDHYLKLAPKELEYKRGWQYGLENNRLDILVRTFIEFDLDLLVKRASESTRLELGLSPMTTLWKSEQLLLDSVQTNFPNELVLGQGSPKWLGNQRFDVWLPERNLAIEYNGSQHYQPVDFFGGEAGFIATKKRDQQKRNKCIDNGVSLLEVDENYRLEDVYTWIRSHLD